MAFDAWRMAVVSYRTIVSILYPYNIVAAACVYTVSMFPRYLSRGDLKNCRIGNVPWFDHFQVNYHFMLGKLTRPYIEISKELQMLYFPP
jgi:hypothetical protein